MRSEGGDEKDTALHKAFSPPEGGGGGGVDKKTLSKPEQALHSDGREV